MVCDVYVYILCLIFLYFSVREESRISGEVKLLKIEFEKFNSVKNEVENENKR